MIYQLPNGKIINITFDQFLSITDEDMQDMMASNFGVYGPRYDKPCFAEDCQSDNFTIFHDELDICNDDNDINVSIDQIILLADLTADFSFIDIPDDISGDE